MTQPVWFQRARNGIRRLRNIKRKLRGVTWSVPEVKPAAVRDNLERMIGAIGSLGEDEELGRLIALVADDASASGLDRPDSFWTLSTGRCGTRAFNTFLSCSPRIHHLHRSFAMRRDYLPKNQRRRNEVFYRTICGLHQGLRFEELVRVAIAHLSVDLRLAYATGRHLFTSNHGFTVFAPHLAALVPHSRFIHLVRDPASVALSFFQKNQYVGQLEPAYIDRNFHRDEYFSIATRHRLIDKIAWYLYVTQVYSEAFVDLLGPERAIRLHSDRFFKRDPEEFQRLADFAPQLELSLEDFQSSYAKKVNAKMHRLNIELSPSARQRVLARFASTTNHLRRHGTLP